MAAGSVRRVIGTVVDVEFPSGDLPEIFNAVNIEMNGTKLVAEVQHLRRDIDRLRDDFSALTQELQRLTDDSRGHW